MTPELIFTIANNGILIFWFLLIVAPRWRGTSFAVQSVAVPVILGLAYLWLFYRVWIGGEGAPGTNYTTLPGVMALFDTPTGAVMGWIHYLVFDLFVGAWEARDAARRRAALDRHPLPDRDPDGWPGRSAALSGGADGHAARRVFAGGGLGLHSAPSSCEYLHHG